MLTFCPIPIGSQIIQQFIIMYNLKSEQYINLIPFYNLIQDYKNHISMFSSVKEMVENIFLFIPFGFLYRYSFQNKRSFKSIILRGFLLSLCIESVQLIYSLIIGFPIRYFDINDLMMNTLGVVLGLLLWKAAFQIEKKIGKVNIRLFFVCIMFVSALNKKYTYNFDQ